MSGLLIMADAVLLGDIGRNVFLVNTLGGRYSPQLKLLFELATRTGGFPRYREEFICMLVQCSCGVFRTLEEVLHGSGVCEHCDQRYWPHEGFFKALLPLSRMDWRLAFDAIVEQQGNYLVRPCPRLAPAPTGVAQP